MTDLLSLSDDLLVGRASIEDHDPFSPTNEMAEVTDDVAFVQSFANVSALRTGEGLVLIDTGSPFAADTIHRTLRRWSPEPAHTAVYTHGHIDHVCGTGPWEAEAQAAGATLRVVGHEAVAPRFDRYCLTAGYNAVVNQRQFRAPGLRWPTDYRHPDLTYRDALDLDVGGTRLRLHHARGETDDGTWVHLPDRDVVFAGDLVIWCAPNAGNPQKAQRYAADWATALRAMAATDAEVLVPGHGLPVRGRDQVRTVLEDTARLLEVLHDQTLALMNEGARLDDIVHGVRAPESLLAKPYLRPIYDEPEFVVRGIWRFYGGWYDGNPASLKPAPDAALAAEVAGLVGGAHVLARRAEALADDGDDASLRLAGHLAEMAAQAAPEDAGIQRVRATVFGRRARAERSLMARGIFRWAEHESQVRAETAEEAAGP